MANTLTISISPQDETDLKANPSWSASKIFRSALKLQRKMDSFIEIYCLEDYIETILRMQEHMTRLQAEILKREEKIDSLKNVLEEKIIGERRLRQAKESDSGSGHQGGHLEELHREVGEQLKQSEGSS